MNRWTAVAIEATLLAVQVAAWTLAVVGALG